MASKPTDYYDLMVTGHTGVGKSTTVDKLLIANPNDINYSFDSSTQIIASENRLNFSDLSVWVANPDQLESIKPRFESLVSARKEKEPQKSVNKFRDQRGNTKSRTTHCELLSNNSTRVRVLDVPGFYDESLAHAASPVECFNIELMIMRNILKIQAQLNLQFRKVLYFFPVRDPLERADAVVQTEMRILMHYFGTTIVEKLVLVATNQKKLSIQDGGDSFSHEEREETMRFFKRCLILLKLYEKETDIPEIPLICISLGETCQSILEKVKGAMVSGPSLKLQFQVCEYCGIKVASSGGEKMVFYPGQDSSQMVAYDKTSCHPKFILDYRWYQKMSEILAKLFTIGYVKSLANFFNVKELCVNCNGSPSAEPCLGVGKEFNDNGQVIICQHSLPEDFVFM